jgi:hypothetical protein
LIITGVAAGALVMTKANVGLFAVAALMLAFVVGNPAVHARLRIVVVALIAAGPLLLVREHLGSRWAAELAVLVGVAVVLMGTISLTNDRVTMDVATLARAAIGFVCVVLATVVFALATGTSIGKLIYGSVTVPLRVAGEFTIPPQTRPLDRDGLAITLLLVAFILGWRRWGRRTSDNAFPWPAAVLGALALWLFIGALGHLTDFGTWLLPLALLPALVALTTERVEIRSAMHLFVPLAVLQILHIYPVAGSQRAWGTVLVGVPCVLALAAAAERLAAWDRVHALLRIAGVVVLGVAVALALDLWPVTVWNDYRHHQKLDLPGAQLLRIEAPQARRLRRITHDLRTKCDTFWSAPSGLGSYYIFTETPSPSGFFSGFPPNLLDREQEQDVVDVLSRAAANGKRVCLLVDTATPFPMDRGKSHPLTSYLETFKHRLDTVEQFVIYVKRS